MQDKNGYLLADSEAVFKIARLTVPVLECIDVNKATYTLTSRSRYSDSLRGSNPGGDKIFCTCPHRP
jgi:hypothetical protein